MKRRKIQEEEEDAQGAISKSSFKYLVKKFLFNYLNNQETNYFIY